MKKAFTLVEILAVIGIVGLVILFGTLSFNPLRKRAAGKAAASAIIADLKLAQQKAVSKKETVSVIILEDSYKPAKVQNPQTIKFAPSGRPVPGYFGTIILSDGTKIVISPIGRIRKE